MNKYKEFHALIDLRMSKKEQQCVLDELDDEIDDFQTENKIRVIGLIQSESLYKDKCHLTMTIEYMLIEEGKPSVYLN